MNLQIDAQVGRIAAEHPLATRVFSRYGIDYCCGGGVPLAEACESRGLDASAVLEEIRLESKAMAPVDESWNDAPFRDLIGHIVAAYHVPLKEELSRLEDMARKVYEVHKDKEPEMLREVFVVFRGLRAELEPHMEKEEQILFPMILGGQGSQADGPIAVMKEEHDQAAWALRRLRDLTNDYVVPPRACNTWRALWRGLDALEESLHQHIHLENNILFPRALRD